MHACGRPGTPPWSSSTAAVQPNVGPSAPHCLFALHLLKGAAELFIHHAVNCEVNFVPTYAYHNGEPYALSKP